MNFQIVTIFLQLFSLLTPVKLKEITLLIILNHKLKIYPIEGYHHKIRKKALHGHYKIKYILLIKDIHIKSRGVANGEQYH